MRMQDNTFCEMQQIKSLLLNKKIPDEYPESISKIKPMELQKIYNIDKFDFINISSFALITKTWVKPLAEYIGDKKCLEIMAGKGVLAKALSDYGVEIIATDNYTWKWHRKRDKKEGQIVKSEELWCDVLNIDCLEAINKYGSGISYIICSWPPYESTDLHKSLLLMRKVNSACKLIYIGEGKGGCTAEDGFFNEARVITSDAQFNSISKLLRSWQGMYDKIQLINFFQSEESMKVKIY